RAARRRARHGAGRHREAPRARGLPGRRQQRQGRGAARLPRAPSPPRGPPVLLASRLTRRALAALVGAALVGAALLAPAGRADEMGPAERRIAEDARTARWDDVLADLRALSASDPARYANGRFDYLTARALAAQGRVDEALPRFERFISAGDLFDVPARLAA